MQSDAQVCSGELEAVLAAAMEAAAERASRRATDVILTARLATAVHMSRVAESARVGKEPARVNVVTSSEAASAGSAVAAQLVRQGGRR